MNYFFKNSNDLFSKFVLNNVFQNVNEGCCIIIIIIIDNPAQLGLGRQLFAAMTLCTTYESNANLLSNFEPVKL